MCFHGLFLGQKPFMEEQGMCYDGIFRGGTGPKSHLVGLVPCERHDLQHFWGPDVLRVKCTSSSSTPASLSPGVPWLDLIGLACHALPQAVMLVDAVSFSRCLMLFDVVS